MFAIEIREDKNTSRSIVLFIMSNEVSKKVIPFLKLIFDIEMLTASIHSNENHTKVKFSTSKIQEVKMLRAGIINAYFEKKNGKQQN